MLALTASSVPITVEEALVLEVNTAFSSSDIHGLGVSLHGCSSKAQPLLLTLDMGYLLTAAATDLGSGVAPLSRSPLQRRTGVFRIHKILKHHHILTISMCIVHCDRGLLR